LEFPSLIGRLKTRCRSRSGNPSRAVSIPYRKTKNSVPFSGTSHSTHRFPSLIGRLKTPKETETVRDKNKFPSLIGRLKTANYLSVDVGNKEFPSLIGRLKTEGSYFFEG